MSENIFLTTESEESQIYIDQALKNKSTSVCDLLLLVDHSIVRLALKERRSGKLLAMEFIPINEKIPGWKDKLENITSKSELLKKYEFSKATAGVISSEYTLVPDSLFKQGDENIYFRKNFAVSPGTLIQAQHINSNKLYSVYGMEKELEAVLRHLFQDPQLWHHSLALIAGNSLVPAGEGKQMWLNIHKNKIDIVITEKKKLHLMNSFRWNINDDVLYYTLFICEQLEMNPDKMTLTLSGDVDESLPLYQMLYKYFRQINFPKKPSSISSAFSDLPFHRYFLLYNFSLCE